MMLQKKIQSNGRNIVKPIQYINTIYMYRRRVEIGEHGNGGNKNCVVGPSQLG